MMPDYPLGQTLDFKFTTRQFSTGAPFLLAGTPAVEVYEDNDLTQIIVGETLTANFDGVAGLNNLRIVATGANGYEAGKSYAAILSAGTVDGVSVAGEVVAQFSIERSPALRPTTVGRTLDVAATGEVGLDLDNTVGTLSAAQFATAFITAAKFASGAIDAAALATDAVNEIRDAITGGAFSLDTDANGAIRIVDGTGLREINTNAGAIALVDVCTVNSDMRGTDSAALASVATEARLSELDEATSGKMANQVDIIQTDTTTDIPASITALNDISVADILTTQMTQAFAADGVAPTLAQALFLIQQMLGDFAISGTTLTVREIDGSTTAATFTLDSATTPTSLTRAT